MSGALATASSFQSRREGKMTDLENVDWRAGGRVHNWRTHIGPKVREIWHTFTAEQKKVLMEDAQQDADAEEWD